MEGAPRSLGGGDPQPVFVSSTSPDFRGRCNSDSVGLFKAWGALDLGGGDAWVTSVPIWMSVAWVSGIFPKGGSGGEGDGEESGENGEEGGGEYASGDSPKSPKSAVVMSRDGCLSGTISESDEGVSSWGALEM